MDPFVLPGFLLPRFRPAVLVMFVTMSLPLPSAAQAAFCGDDVSGLRIACACGDDVVSDTVLSSSDPVVAERCSGDGLVLVAPAGSDGITLDLGGHSLAGSGRGVGIRVVRGGALGSVILGGGDAGQARAEVANFRTGISASGRSALLELRGVHVHHNVADGVRIHSSGTRVEDVEASDNGRDGASLFGHGLEVSGVVAERNLSDGLQVRGAGSTVDAETRANRRHGMIVSGRGNRVDALRSDGNGGAGLSTTGSRHEVGDFRAEGNALGVVRDRAVGTIGVPE